MASTASGWQYAVPNDTLVAWPAVSQAVADKLELQVGAQKTGHVLITSQTVSGSSLVTFDNVFTSGFENYIIEFNGVSSGPTAQMRSKFRAGGTATGAGITNYAYVVTQATASNTGPTNRAWGTASSEIELMDMDSSANSNQSFILNMFSPQATKWTRWTWHASNVGSGTAITAWQLSSGSFSNTTSFDGIEFKLVSGTITGTFRIYGLRNS